MPHLVADYEIIEAAAGCRTHSSTRTSLLVARGSAILNAVHLTDALRQSHNAEPWSSFEDQCRDMSGHLWTPLSRDRPAGERLLRRVSAVQVLCSTEQQLPILAEQYSE